MKYINIFQGQSNSALMDCSYILTILSSTWSTVSQQDPDECVEVAEAVPGGLAVNLGQRGLRRELGRQDVNGKLTRTIIL